MAKGEGSRGGSVIGRTRSGKAVYQHTKPREYDNFSPRDHYDAMDIHRKESKAHQKEADSFYATHKKVTPAYTGTVNNARKHEDLANQHWAAADTDRAMAEGRMGKSMNLNKSAMGAGSRGGKVIGRTRSGKPIYDKSAYANIGKLVGGPNGTHAEGAANAKTTAANKKQVAARFSNYTKEDHEDAAYAHYKKANEKGATHEHTQAHYQINHAHQRLSDEGWGQTQKRKAKFGKSIECPECSEPIAHRYAIKSVAALAKGLGGTVTGKMAGLVKGDGIKNITCPSCVATISPQYMVKSLGRIARENGFDIQPALEGMFKRPQVNKSLNLPVNSVPPAFGAINRENDARLANAIKQNGGFFGQSGLPAAVETQQATSRLEQIQENQIDTDEGIVAFN